MENERCQLSDVVRTLSDVGSKVDTLSAVVGAHVQEQKAINASLITKQHEHEHRLRTLEEHKAVMQATLPKKWLDTETVEARMAAMEKAIGGINVTLAKWAGISVAGMIAAQMLFQIGLAAMKFFRS